MWWGRWPDEEQQLPAHDFRAALRDARRAKPSPADLANRRAEICELFETTFSALVGEKPSPLTRPIMRQITNWLRDILKTVPGEPVAERVIRRRRMEGEDDDGTTRDAFYLTDLHRVSEAVRCGKSSPPLVEYLTPNSLSEDQRRSADDLAVITAVPGSAPHPHRKVAWSRDWQRRPRLYANKWR